MTLTLLLLLSSLIAVTTFIPLLLQEGYSQSNQQTSSAESTSPIDCKSIASQIGSNAFPIQNPHKEICDISIIRDSPQIVDQNGTVLNKFLVANTLVEIMGNPPVATTAGGSNGGTSGAGTNNTTLNASSSISNTQRVMAMVEFALLQTELKPVLNLISKTNWTIVAIHNHALLETPDTIFVHADAKGSLQSIIAPIIGVLSLQQQSVAEEGGGGKEMGEQQQQQQGQQPANNTSENPLADIGEKLGEVFTGGGGEGSR
ncbi:MAG TPA: DUF1259 domain-containing protein [Nitrososphaeraceae archaeon]|nr:DUF1259 domain-containing protein [Nitrososphaeraceae archaeon]